MEPVASNVAHIRRRIASAAGRAGRDPSSVRLIAVTKTVDVERAAEAISAGVLDLGESRVQEARRKFDVIGAKAQWHMIGPLQTNKAKYCPGLFSLIHSLDRLELMEELSRRSLGEGLVMRGLLQVNLTGETQKGGCRPQDAADILKAASRLPGLRIEGLMTIPRFSDDPEDSRPVFRALLELRADLDRIGIENTGLDEISAGMTGDFEVAVEEGATMVRVGSAIFGERG